MHVRIFMHVCVSASMYLYGYLCMHVMHNTLYEYTYKGNICILYFLIAALVECPPPPAVRVIVLWEPPSLYKLKEMICIYV